MMRTMTRAQVCDHLGIPDDTPADKVWACVRHVGHERALDAAAANLFAPRNPFTGELLPAFEPGPREPTGA